MKTTLTTALITLASIVALQADVPLLINYQGSVTDAGGAAIGPTTPVNRRVIFRIWDHSSSTDAGNRKWTEEQTVTILNGEFSIMLGQGTQYSTETKPALDTVFADNTTVRFLEITVDNGDGTIDPAVDQAIAPRQQLTSVGYAMRAKMADSVSAGSDLLLTPNAGATGNFGLGWYGDATTDRTFNSINNINGPVLYGTGGGALGSKNGSTEALALRWNSDGNVGIGSAALVGGTTKLVVQGDDAGTGEGAQQIMIRGNTTPTKKLILGIDTTNDRGTIQTVNSSSAYLPLHLNRDGGNIIMALGENNPGGNVGIGIANPTSKLHVNGTFNATTSVTTPALSATTSVTTPALSATTSVTTPLVTTANSLTPLEIKPANPSGSNLAGAALTLSGGAPTGNGAGGALVFKTGQSSSSGSAVRTLVQRMIIDGAGVVGIGSGTAPASTTTNKLYVTGDSTADAPDQVIIRGSTDTDLRLDLGMKTNTTPRGVIQARDGGTAYLQLALNPGGGQVTVGGNASTWGAAPLCVRGMGATSINNHTSYDESYGETNALQAIDNVNGASDNDTSIYAEGSVHGARFRAFSDQRIKNIFGVSDGSRDLLALRNIEITDYTHKDSLAQGSERHKKVIAQQVEKVFPQAVGKTTDVVPDIYKKADVKDGWVELKTTLKKGERVRLIAEKDEGVHEVLEVREGAFRTSFVPVTKSIFVYGRLVEDFRVVDYEAISMLNVSATQEIARRLEAKSAEVEALEARVKKLEARDKARDAKLAALEKLLLSADKPAARTASLKKTADGAE
jgi:hypothetical protein